jgi:sulfur-carrier protein
MLLTVKLFATFRKGRFDVAQLDRPEGATIGDVVDGLGIPRDEVGILMVSGRHAQLADRLSAGDTLSIFPLVGGG